MLPPLVVSPPKTDGRSRVDAGANWGGQRGRSRAVTPEIEATWACC